MDQYIGKLLDNRYEIIEVIGVGGMAKVYKARCHRLNRLVAVKILRDDLSHDEDLRRRFNAESQAVAMLSHPNIVAVYDVSRSDENNYIVMELIDGISLKQYMEKKGNKLNWREALHFITQIVKALGHAHSRGIIHRDIKPHNVMVLRDGSVKVADFGIARLANASSSTLTKDTLGSVHYISPEQARGSHIDARSDLYSAGVVLYEMITGRLPFEGDTPVSVAIQHINGVPLSPRDLDPELPEALETITMKAMASNVDKRYISADAMLADLEEFRKNPSINFDYNAADLLKESAGKEDNPDGKTRPVPVGLVSEHMRRSGTASERSHSGRRSSYRDEERRVREEELDDRREQSWPMYVAIVAILLFTVGMIWFLFTNFLKPLFAPAPDYVVPNLLGLIYEETAENRELLNDFDLVKVATVTDERAEGTIIKQTPDPETTVKDPGTEIKVTVSGGPKTIIMPDVSEKEYTDAFVLLQNLGLIVSTPEYENHEEIPKGHVISFTPLENAVLKPGDKVQLVVSTGPRDKTEQVPLFIGQSVDWARDKITLHNLVVGEEFEVWSSEYPAGTVVDQSVEAYSEVPQGTKINLQVSKGPDPSDPNGTNSGLTNNTVSGKGEQTFSIVLPQNAGQVKVTVKDGSTVILDTQVNTALEAVLPCTVKGSGVKQYDIYFDNTFNRSQIVNFSR